MSRYALKLLKVASLYVLCWTGPISAAESSVVIAASDHGFDPEGLLIDTVIIDARNIYEPEDDGFSALIFTTANRLHRVTRSGVIEQELLFAPGDRFLIEVAEETARNLRKRLALNEAHIEVRPSKPGHVALTVVTRDQWSLLGNLRISRDGNVTDYQFGLEERNFLGYNQLLAFDYFVQETDENFIRWRFANPRFLGRPVQISTDYNDDPTNEIRSVSLGYPFYDLMQQFSMRIRFAESGGRTDLYKDTLKVAEWRNQGDVTSLGLDYRWGSYTQKVGLGFDYDYVFETTMDTLTLSRNDSLGMIFPTDSLYHQFRLSAILTDQDFVVVKRINGFYYDEDITLEQALELSYARAFLSDFKDHVYDRFSLAGKCVRQVGSHIVGLSYSRLFWYKGDRNIRRTSVFSAYVYNNGLRFITGALRASYVSDWRDDGTNALNLGGKNGLRGYDVNVTSGNRSLLVNLEGRFFPGLELLSVPIGAVAFVDVGRAWNSGEPLTVKDIKRSFGVGLRLSMERFTKTEMVRIDLAYGQEDTWHLTFGAGQYF